ncbi:hypothetical protein CKY47_35330 [Saccharothrix yanglingensis]|uniref:Uncharacterized protein n=1 Tax=Saccharothrix yanglingensis TaxID=659496 RepID=A0ABU0XAE8_9PSEU|nr:hypothetical protein [Saccharothrix yanglingensis]
MRLIVDDLRDVGQVLYPPVLAGAGLVPALRETADRCGLALDLDVPPSGLTGPSASRVCLLLVDHLRSLRPGTSVVVRIRGGLRLVGVHLREDRPGHASRHRWAVVRCA